MGNEEMIKISKCNNRAFDLRVQYIASMISIIEDVGIDDVPAALRTLATMSSDNVVDYMEYAKECDFVFPDV